VFALQLGHTRVAWLLLVTSVSSTLVFAWIASTQRDWLAAGIALACLTVAIRMVGLLLRRRKLRNTAVTIATSRRGSATGIRGVPFMTHGFQSVGVRFRSGVIIVGHSGAAFVPTSGWKHLLWELFASPFIARFRFVDLVVDMPADADTSTALHAVAAKHGGFFIDDDWRWTPSQRWLTRPDVEGVVSLARHPPPHFAARWAPTAAPLAATVRYVFRRVASIGLVGATTIFVAGYVAWKWSGDADYLVAGISYAAILTIAIVTGLVLGKRALRKQARSSG
jgi:hypothetical protein